MLARHPSFLAAGQRIIAIDDNRTSRLFYVVLADNRPDRLYDNRLSFMDKDLDADLTG